MKIYLLSVFSLLLVNNLSAQKKEITLEDIWKTGTFRSNSVLGLVSMKDGIHYSTIQNDTIFRFSYEKDTAPELIVCKSQLLLNGSTINIDNYQ
ncbi:MAG: S9 family peptidase, partial [Bacteroidetes bacterium]|nr:S9 family peptidase [Bacteroidota bacterium]